MKTTEISNQNTIDSAYAIIKANIQSKEKLDECMQSLNDNVDPRADYLCAIIRER